MEWKRPTPDQVRVGLGAMKYLALHGHGGLAPADGELMAALQRIHGTELDPAQILPLGPEEVRASISDPVLRHQIVCGLIVASLIDGEASPEEAKVVDAFARALEVQEASVGGLRHAACKQRLALRYDVMRRFWVADKLRERVAAEGLGAVVRVLRAGLGNLSDPELARRYAALGELPDGTLGREYIRFLDRNGWPLPGEKGAPPDIIVYHDMAHVLGDYGTRPDEEVEVACFSAGFRKKDPFTFVFFVLLQFHVGIRMTPGAPAERGMFDVERALAALRRGAAMNVDLSDGWEFWPVVDVPVTELRKAYGIAPKG